MAAELVEIPASVQDSLPPPSSATRPAAASPALIVFLCKKGAPRPVFWHKKRGCPQSH